MLKLIRLHRFNGFHNVNWMLLMRFIKLNIQCLHCRRYCQTREPLFSESGMSRVDRSYLFVKIKEVLTVAYYVRSQTINGLREKSAYHVPSETKVQTQRVLDYLPFVPGKFSINFLIHFIIKLLHKNEEYECTITIFGYQRKLYQWEITPIKIGCTFKNL